MELKRIFGNKKFAGITLFLLIAVVGLYLFQEYRSAVRGGYSLKEEICYRNELTEQIKEKSFAEALDVLSIKKLLVENEAQSLLLLGKYNYQLAYQDKVLQEEIVQLEHLNTYKAYLENITQQSGVLSEVSIFQHTDSLALENIEKTKQAYQALEDNQVVYGDYKAFSSVLEYDEMHYLIVVFIMVLVWNFFEEEKKGLRGIIYAAPKGRAMLALRRIGILGMAAGMFVALSYLLVFLASFWLYGGAENLHNSIQSIASMRECVLPLSILEYFVYSVGFHILASFSLALFIWMILTAFQSRICSILVAVMIFGTEFFMYQMITAQSPIAVLKYVNLYNFILPDKMLQGYCNFEVLGILVNREKLFLIAVLLLGCISAASCVVISCKRKTISETGKIQAKLEVFGKKVRRMYHKQLSKLSVFGLEAYKIIAAQKGWLILAIWLVVLVSDIENRQLLYVGNGSYMQEVYAVYSGTDDGRLEKYVAQQTEFFEALDAEYEKVAEKYENGEATKEELADMDYKVLAFSAKRSGLDDMTNQLSYIQNLKHEKGIDAWFLDNKGYKVLWTGDGIYDGAGYGEQHKSALLSITVLIFLLGFLFSYDRLCGMDKLLLATALGREKLFHIKMRLTAVLCLLVCMITYGIRVYEVNQTYTLSCMSAPVQSLYFMEDFPIRISIGTFMGFLFIMHFAALFSISMIVCVISLQVDGYRGILLSLFLLVVPSVMYMSGIKWCEKIAAIQPVMYVEALQEHGFAYSCIMIIITCLFGVLGYMYTKRKWCRKAGKYAVANT